MLSGVPSNTAVNITITFTIKQWHASTTLLPVAVVAEVRRTPAEPTCPISQPLGPEQESIMMETHHDAMLQQNLHFHSNT
jgi:hypothetical protein